MSPTEQLAWEARWRWRAVVLAVIAAVLPLAGAIVGALSTRGERAPNNSVDRLLFYHDHSTAFMIAAVLQALGALAIAATLVFLFRAVKARRAELPQGSLAAAIIGPVLQAVSQVVLYAYLLSKSADFASSGKLFYPQAHAILHEGILTVLSLIGLIGQFTIAAALVMISLNAMRSGLLTRFLGVLGMIVGALFIIPVGTPLPVVQAFWLLALAVLIAGRWPRGTPPAWTTGEAVPWPSQQELREAREQGGGNGNGRGDRRGGDNGRNGGRQRAAAQHATPASRSGTPHPSSKKRKRKRRT